LQPIEHPLRSDFIPKQFRIGSNGENWESSVMSPTRLPICAAAFALLASGPAFADPAYVPSTVNLREAGGTKKPVLAKIPAGTRLEATNCNDWCEVEWQGKKGFVIANALDRSGKATEPRAESKPVTESRAESKPATESHPESKPAAKPRPASKSASEPRTTGVWRAARSHAVPGSMLKMTTCRWGRRWSTAGRTIIRTARTSTLTGPTTTATDAATTAGEAARARRGGKLDI
jgi:uncharacterized protein YraI